MLGSIYSIYKCIREKEKVSECLSHHRSFVALQLFNLLLEALVINDLTDSLLGEMRRWKSQHSQCGATPTLCRPSAEHNQCSKGVTELLCASHIV